MTPLSSMPRSVAATLDGLAAIALLGWGILASS
jgi:hypothetical protein